MREASLHVRGACRSSKQARFAGSVSCFTSIAIDRVDLRARCSDIDRHVRYATYVYLPMCSTRSGQPLLATSGPPSSSLACLGSSSTSSFALCSSLLFILHHVLIASAGNIIKVQACRNMQNMALRAASRSSTHHRVNRYLLPRTLLQVDHRGVRSCRGDG